MSAKYESHRVINGTFGEVWIDSDYVAEVTGLQAKITFTKQDVNQALELMTGSKTVGAKGAGTLKMNKVSSRMINMYRNELETGNFPVCTIISKLADPDAYGCERVKLSGVQFDELTLADWEVGKFQEESIPFTFTGFKMIDSIAAR